MRQLMTCSDGIYAGQLQQALEAAGITVRVTTETRNAYLGGNLFVVWVSDDADLEAVRRACESLVAPDTGEPEAAPTRVCHSDGETQCMACGYDLRGQMEDGKCPECGHPYRLVVPTRCSGCGAEVPSDFDLCWRCGRELGPPPLPRQPPPLPA